MGPTTALALLHGGAELYEYTGVLLGGLTWPAWRLDLRRLLNQAADLGWRVVATVVYYHAKAVYNTYVDLAYVPVHALRVVGVLLHVPEVLLRLAVVLFNAFGACTPTTSCWRATT